MITVYDNENGAYNIKPEPVEIKTEIKTEMEDPMIGYHNNSSIFSDSFQDSMEHPGEVKKRKGRPKGAKTGTGKKPPVNRVIRPLVKFP